MKGFVSRLRRLLCAGSLPTACAAGCIVSPLRGYGAISTLSQPSAPSNLPLHTNGLYTWSAIFVIVFASVVGDVLLARSMKQVGDVGALRRHAGLGVVIGRTLGNPFFLFGVAAMAVAFFSLLFALSWGDVSLVAPAAASLTFIGNAVAARIFLHERVDRRRWIAASLVAAGVALLAG
jgi:drug/metabolite transporter (DMT)-like permease